MHHRKRHEAARERLKDDQIPQNRTLYETHKTMRVKHIKVFLLVVALCSCCLGIAAVVAMAVGRLFVVMLVHLCVEN